LTREQYIANDITYTVGMDDPIPPGLRPMALVQVVLLDELTAQAPMGSITLDATLAGLSPRVAADGLVGWAGIPRNAFSALRLNNYDFQGTISADRYVPLRLPIHVPMDGNFPASFTPVDLGTLNLHRLPVVLSGRVVNARIPVPKGVANAAITMTGLWRTLPPSFLAVAPSPVQVVSLQPDLYFARTAVVSTMTTATLQPAVGQDKQLTIDIGAGGTQVRLSDSVGLNPGNQLEIDYQDAERTEYLTILSLAGTVPTAQPRTITVSYPTKFAHRPGVPVRKVTPVGLGAPTQFSADAIAGDSCIFLQTMANLPPAIPLPPPQAVVISGGGNPDEFHMVRQFSAKSDGDGFFRLPPMSRVAQLTLLASAALLGNLSMTVAPDYSGTVFRTDFVYE